MLFNSMFSPLCRSEKRVCNKKIKEVLGVRLMFPSYKEGLAAINDGNITPFA